MNSSDEFQNEYQKAKKKIDEINENLKIRIEKVTKRLTTSSVDAKLKIQLDDFLHTMNLLKLKAGDSLERSNYKKECIAEVSTTYEAFKRQIDKFVIQSNLLSDSEKYSQNSSPKKKPMTRQEFEMMKEEKFKEGDVVMDELKGNAKLIKNGAVMIRDEINLQDPLLNDLEKDVEKIESKMIRSENKLANYLNKSSSTCLYWTIVVEFVFLLLLFAL